MNKICIIGVYFGKLPNYFSLWLKSAEKNPTIDFFVFTDQLLVDLPKNVFCINTTIKEIQERATATLGFEACLSTPYKCCDYKVLYGLIFKDYVAKYEYWGHTDFDLIYGDIQSFFDKYNLCKYDRFFWLGHLAFYKNTETVNNYYRLSGAVVDYKKVFSSPQNFAFDEMSGIVAIYSRNNLRMFKKKVFIDIASIYRRYRRISMSIDDEKIVNYKYQTFYWEKGKIYRAYSYKGEIFKEEFAYMHFKKRPNYEVLFDVEKTEAFYLTNAGFICKEKEVDLQTIKEMNPYPGWIKEKLEWCKDRSKYYFNAIRRRLEGK